MNWYLEVLKKYAVFEGRARRKEYWMYFLFYFIFAIALGFLGEALNLGSTLNNIYVLAHVIPTIAVGVRRMHDIGKSGWWILFPIVNLVFLCMSGEKGQNQYGPDPKGVSV